MSKEKELKRIFQRGSGLKSDPVLDEVIADLFNPSQRAARLLAATEKSLVAHERAVQANPGDRKSWKEMATDLENLHKYGNAIEALQEALRLDPNDTAGWLQLRRNYRSLERYDKAVEADLEAVRIAPNDVSAWFSLGVDHRELGHDSEVMAVYKRLRKLDPSEAKLLAGPWFRLRVSLSRPERRQLVVLLAGGSWVAIVATLVAVGDYSAATALVMFMVLSVPGILFSAIFFWWFGRQSIHRGGPPRTKP